MIRLYATLIVSSCVCLLLITFGYCLYETGRSDERHIKFWQVDRLEETCLQKLTANEGRPLFNDTFIECSAISQAEDVLLTE